MTSENVRVCISWVVPEAALPTVTSEIEESHGEIVKDPKPFVPPFDEEEDYEDPQFAPLLVIASVIAIGFLIKRISDILLDHKRPGGLIVDARGDEMVIRPALHVPRESVLVITKFGSKMYMADKKDEAFAVLTDLAKSHSI